MSIFGKSKSNKPKKRIEKIEANVAAESGSKNSGYRNSRSNFLIKQSWMTEKAGGMALDRKYIFIVADNANKSEVKKEIESSYGVKVNDVNMVVRKGKAKRLGQSFGRTSDFKKAIVTLKHGYKIEGLIS